MKEEITSLIHSKGFSAEVFYGVTLENVGSVFPGDLQRLFAPQSTSLVQLFCP